MKEKINHNAGINMNAVLDELEGLPIRMDRATAYLKSKNVNLDKYTKVYDVFINEDKTKVAVHGQTKGFQEMVTVHDYKTGKVLKSVNVGYSNKFRIDAFM